MIRGITSVVAVVLTTLLLGGCGDDGLDVSCADYLERSAADQKTLARDYLVQVVGTKGAPGEVAILTTTATLIGHCGSHPDDRLGDVRF